MVQTTTKLHMKKTISVRFILGSAILAWALIGNYPPQSSNAQDPPTDLISTSPDSAPAASTLLPDIDPNSPLAQVARLVQAGVEQSVILTYIGNATSLFNLDSDKIIYLNDLGVPTEIINAMMQRDQQLQQMGVAVGAPSTPPADATETAATQPAEVTVNYFYDTLTPYGRWVDVAGYGRCWRPTVVVSSPGWQPYCDDGHWVYTDCGWYWISGYSWGWATFHYGRWFQIPRYGWCWWPETTWAPSWVCWRYDRDYCGWAPLPPHAIYQPGVGFLYDGRRVSAGFNFGLGVGVFTFVATRDFCDLQPWRHRIEKREVARIYDRTTVIQNIDFDSHHHGIVNAGIPPHDISAVTRQEIHPITIRDEDRSVGHGDRREQFERDGRTLMVNRPHFVGTPALSSHPGTAPATEHPQNEIHPIVHGNGNNILPHAAVNPNLHPNLNQPQPRIPQTQQPEVPHVTTPNSPEHNHAITTPAGNYQGWPGQNQTPNHNYGSGHKVISPRAQGLEQQPVHGATYNPQPQGNATVKQPSPNHPAANHYDPSAAPLHNSYSPPPNTSHNNDQNYNHSEPPPQAVQPHASNQSSSSSPSNKQGQDKDNNQRGH
jgi:hypothetical protein